MTEKVFKLVKNCELYNLTFRVKDVEEAYGLRGMTEFYKDLFVQIENAMNNVLKDYELKKG